MFTVLTLDLYERRGKEMKKWNKIIALILITTAIYLTMPSHPDKPLPIRPPVIKPFVYLIRQK